MEFERVMPGEILAGRTVLAPLEALGRGTMHVESLSSYFQRLADQHDVSPKLLAREFVLPMLGVNNRVGEVQSDRYWRSSFFSGMGEVAAEWCAALEDLTGVANLRGLTLLPLHGLIGMHGSACSMRRWCPLCLDESTVSDVPYGQLLWEIGCVKACPTHNVRLLSEHGCSPQEAIPSLRVKPMPHLCGSCSRPLAQSPSILPNEATKEEVLFAQAVGMVLAGPLFQGGGEGSGQSIADFLWNAVRISDQGFATRAVQRLGASKGEVSEWLNRKHLPSLPQAFTIATSYGSRLVDALIRDEVQDLLVLPPRVRQRRRIEGSLRGNKHAWDNTQMLREIRSLQSPPSETEAGAMFGISARELRRLHPDVCTFIAHRRAEWRSAEASRQREERLKAVEYLINQMVSEGIIPTIARLEKRLVLIPKTFLFKERIACKRLILAGKAKLNVI